MFSSVRLKEAFININTIVQQTHLHFSQPNMIWMTFDTNYTREVESKELYFVSKYNVLT